MSYGSNGIIRSDREAQGFRVWPNFIAASFPVRVAAAAAAASVVVVLAAAPADDDAGRQPLNVSVRLSRMLVPLRLPLLLLLPLV